MNGNILILKGVRAKFWTGFILIAICFSFFQKMALAEEFSELKSRMQEIDGKNKALQEQLNKQKEVIEKQEEAIKGLLERLAALERKEKPIEQPVLDRKIVMPAMSSIPKLKIRGFSDISFKLENDINAPEQNPSTFGLGQLDFFITSELSDKISVLNETVFEFGSNNEAALDIERLHLQYALGELLNIKIGRLHTPLGFWNDEYHHSAWTYTTAFRPLVHNWEDDNGIMPNHMVGLLVSGKKDLGNFDFEYDLGIANGRGEARTKIPNIQDRNDSKAFVSRVSISPDFIPGLKFGTSTYLDKIPPGSTATARNGEIRELILGGHIIYFKDKLELLAEAFSLNHDDEVSHKDYKTWAGYLQGAYQFKKWKPYYRFDIMDFGGGDPFYAPDDIDIFMHTLGIRWDPITWNSIKLEYSYSGRDDADDRHSVTIQSAFTF